MINLSGFAVMAQREEVNSSENDKSLSPYFFVKSDDPDTNRLPLKNTSVKVNIAGVIAEVSITQVYENTGKNTLEAVYIFPASSRAAVFAMKMKIGEREIIAMVQEREKARQMYEQAKSNGQTASLLEQERPNVFSMNVANILPEDVIEVELKYTEVLIPESGIYSFVFPTVVGPRYSNSSAGSGEDWVANPYLEERELPSYTFDIHVDINAGMPIQSLYSPSHKVDVTYRSKDEAAIRLKDTEMSKGNKDFILDYRLADKKIVSGLLLYKGEKENYFLAMIQPPKKVLPEEIPPREYIFIVDVSGSMHGFPLEVSKKLMKTLLESLQPRDRFNILLFAGGSEVFSQEPVTAEQENIARAVSFINKQGGGGGTELLSALKKAMSIPASEGVSRSFVIVTDGYVRVEREAFDFIRKNLGNANFFSFGIGSSVNRYIIEGMANVGRGLPFIVTTKAEAIKVAEKFRKYISTPLLTNVKMQFKGFDAYDVEPMNIPDVLAERPVLIYGKWKGPASGSLKFTGVTGKGEYSQSLNTGSVKPMVENLAIKYLWAREKIRLLDDYAGVSRDDTGLKNEITLLGLKYNLLTRYTSFIALDSEIRNQSGNSIVVKQPLPLPEGVSNYAVSAKLKGGAIPITRQMTAFEENESDEKKIFMIIEDMPEFPGGMDSLKIFIIKNIRFPQSLIDEGTEGTVYVSFIIKPDGSIDSMKIIRGLSTEADKEALRVIRLTDKMWSPGKQRGKPVAVSMVVPVKFKLDRSY
jgi:Ca-activated chloride channel family protein